jgi:hypothetical protein
MNSIRGSDPRISLSKNTPRGLVRIFEYLYEFASDPPAGGELNSCKLVLDPKYE